MEFKTYKIKDIGTVQGGGTPSTKIKEYYGGEIPWITPKDLSSYNNVYISRGERNITLGGLEHSSAKLLPKNTVLMTSRAPIGYLAIARNELSTNQGFKSIICNESIIRPRYLYYLLKNEMKRIKALGTGSTFSEISGTVVKNIEITIPNLIHQKRIELFLSAIDERIENNNNTIANLEELSQTIFKHWFIDFEFPDENGNPYKSSGGKIENQYPKGWSIESANHIYDISIGKTPPRKLNHLFSLSQGVLWASISDMKKAGPFLIETKEYLTNEAVENYNVKLAPKHTVLLSFKLTVGRVKIAHAAMATNEAIAHFIPKSNSLSYLYTYLYLKNFNYNQLGNTSSIATAVNSKIIKAMPILIPDAECLEKFETIIHPLFDTINLLQSQITSLTELRDSLLPKLMSGEIELPENLEV